EGPTMGSAAASAVAGFYEVIAPAAPVRDERAAVVEAEAPDEALAFARAVQKLVALFDIERFVAAAAEVALEPGPPARCRISMRGESFDPARHPYGVEVKAVTRHGLVFDRAARRVRLVLDI
ncbi:MAG TPA: archease, partial [Candidatus Thermoplasmatota archaeon]